MLEIVGVVGFVGVGAVVGLWIGIGLGYLLHDYLLHDCLLPVPVPVHELRYCVSFSYLCVYLIYILANN